MVPSACCGAKEGMLDYYHSCLLSCAGQNTCLCQGCNALHTQELSRAYSYSTLALIWPSYTLFSYRKFWSSKFVESS